MPVLEVRTYELEPGGRVPLERLFQEEVLPLLRAWGHDVVHWGGSPHDPDAFVLLRAYPDEASRRASQDAFYGSGDWREGPRTRMLALIRTYTSGVLPIETAVLEAWRSGLAASTGGRDR